MEISDEYDDDSNDVTNPILFLKQFGMIESLAKEFDFSGAEVDLVSIVPCKIPRMLSSTTDKKSSCFKDNILIIKGKPYFYSPEQIRNQADHCFHQKENDVIQSQTSQYSAMQDDDNNTISFINDLNDEVINPNHHINDNNTDLKSNKPYKRICPSCISYCTTLGINFDSSDNNDNKDENFLILNNRGEVSYGLERMKLILKRKSHLLPK